MKRARELSTLLDFEDLVCHKPIVQRIIHYLSPISFLQLWACSPAFFRACSISPQLHFYHCLRYALRIVFHNNEKVVQSMLRTLAHGYSLTGGFLLYVLNGDYVTIAEDRTYDLDFVACQKRETYIDSPVHVLRDLFKREFGIESLNIYTNSRISNIIEFVCNDGRKVSTIYVKCSVPEYVESFDFEFCKNVYYKNRLYVKNVESVCNRFCVMDATRYLRDVWSLDIARLYQEAFPKVTGRIQKYCNRNYRVIMYNTSCTDAWTFITDNIDAFLNELGCIRGTLYVVKSADFASDPQYRMVTNQFCRVWEALWNQ